jgi:hypothetical protein
MIAPDRSTSKNRREWNHQSSSADATRATGAAFFDFQSRTDRGRAQRTTEPAIGRVRTGSPGLTLPKPTNADQTNAFGKCVSSTAKAASITHTQAVIHAALTCKAERKSDPAAFKSKYKRFSACVKALTNNS